jgi:hypothetical protein
MVSQSDQDQQLLKRIEQLKKELHSSFLVSESVQETVGELRASSFGFTSNSLPKRAGSDLQVGLRQGDRGTRNCYSGSLSPDPPISAGKSLSLGNPS